MAVGNGQLYLAVQEVSNALPPTDDQFFYLIELDGKTLYPHKAYNMSIVVNNTSILFNYDNGLGTGIIDVGYDNDMIVMNIYATTYQPGSVDPAIIGNTILALNPELLEVEAARGKIVLDDPTTNVNSTIRIYNVFKPPHNQTIANYIIGNITLIDMALQATTPFLYADFTGQAMNMNILPKTTPLAIPLVFNFEKTGSPPEARSLRIPLPNTATTPPVLPNPFQDLPYTTDPTLPPTITFNVTVTG